jgi:hypothetical protein
LLHRKLYRSKQAVGVRRQKLGGRRQESEVRS